MIRAHLALTAKGGTTVTSILAFQAIRIIYSNYTPTRRLAILFLVWITLKWYSQADFRELFLLEEKLL